MRRTLCVLLLALCPLPHAALAVEFGGGWTLDGFVKSLDLAYRAPKSTKLEDGVVSANRLRLNLRGEVAAGWRLETSAEYLLQASHPAGQLPLPAEPASRALDLEWHDGADAPFAQQLQLDRLNLTGQRGNWEWCLGRQAIGFGRIGLYAPLDIIAPFPPDALDTEVRPGIDALRLSRFFGMAGQLDLIAAFGEGSERNSQLASLVTNAAETDFLLLGGRLLDRTVLGGGVAGQFGGIGLKGELVGYRGTATDPHRHFVIGAVATDFRLPGDWVINLEYLYNGAGTNEPADYPRIAASAFVRDGLGFLTGRHYLLAGPSWQWHPLSRFDLLLLANLGDGSALVRPLLEVSLADEAVLQLFCTLYTGSAPGAGGLPTSEFGGSGENLGLLFKFFF